MFASKNRIDTIIAIHVTRTQSNIRSARDGTKCSNCDGSERYASSIVMGSTASPGCVAGTRSSRSGRRGSSGRFLTGFLHNSHCGSPPRPSSFTWDHLTAQARCRTAKSPRHPHSSVIPSPDSKSACDSGSKQMRHTALLETAPPPTSFSTSLPCQPPPRRRVWDRPMHPTDRLQSPQIDPICPTTRLAWNAVARPLGQHVSPPSLKVPNSVQLQPGRPHRVGFEATASDVEATASDVEATASDVEGSNSRVSSPISSSPQRLTRGTTARSTALDPASPPSIPIPARLRNYARLCVVPRGRNTGVALC
jgi:hypothetical protein